MTRNTTIKTKAKQQKAVSRAVKQAGFKNIKEAKEALRKANKEKITKTEACCATDDSCKVSMPSLSAVFDRLLKLEQDVYKKEDSSTNSSCANSACSKEDISYSANKSDWSLDNIFAFRSWSPEDNAYYLNIKIKL
jgi:hypothetical protein